MLQGNVTHYKTSLTYYLVTLKNGIYHGTLALKYVLMGRHVWLAVLKVLYHSYKKKILMLYKPTASSIGKYRTCFKNNTR